MKTYRYCIFVNLLLASVVVGLLVWLYGTDKPATDPDARQAIVLNPVQRGYELAQMRGFLASVQGITAAISRQQMETVADLARASGDSGIRPQPTGLKDKLPLEFEQISLSVHQDFDQLADDAERLSDPVASLRQLADITAKCVACHASYRLRLAPS